MEPLGKVKTVSSRGHIIIIAPHAPRMGEYVCDEQARSLGRILRIFGPVTRPYVAVLPVEGIRGELHKMIGKTVFLEKRGNKHAKEKRGSRRRGR